MVAAVAVPRVVANLPPEYPHYLPPTYNRIHANDLHQHWQEWDRTKEWDRYDWFRNELRPDVVQQRQTLIQREREEHRIKRERIRQALVQQQQEQHRLEMEHKRKVAKQQRAQHTDKFDHPNAKREKEKQEGQQKEKKQKKKKKPNKEKQKKHEKKGD